MPWDIIFTFLYYSIQPLLAAMGIYVAVKPPTTKKEIIIISISFAICALVGIYAGIVLQVQNKKANEEQRLEHNNEMTEQKKIIGRINGDLIQSHLDQEYMKGQLSGMALGIGKSG